jgi:hypothetical protein
LNISVDFSALRRAKWHQFALRFMFGGIICVLAGLISQKYGPGVGGLFMAFPAIFPASATLLENEEKEKKERVGLHGSICGRKVAGVDAAGAAMGCLGMIAFAAIVWQLLPKQSAPTVLIGATAAWFCVSVLVWQMRRMWVHSRKR